MSKVIELDDSNFTKEVRMAEKPVVLVDFFATWCEPCKMMAPIVEEIAEEYDYVKVCRVDVDKAAKISARFGIISVPTFMVFHNGQIAGMQIGAQPKDVLVSMVL